MVASKTDVLIFLVHVFEIFENSSQLLIHLYPPVWLFLGRLLLGKFFHAGTTEDKFVVATLRVSRNENSVIGAQLSNESSQDLPDDRLFLLPEDAEVFWLTPPWPISRSLEAAWFPNDGTKPSAPFGTLEPEDVRPAQKSEAGSGATFLRLLPRHR